MSICGPICRRIAAASLRFLARSATDRFLKIHLNRVFTGRTLIALLGHELQHAVEVADAGGVDSVADLRDLYRRLGEKTGMRPVRHPAARQAGLYRSPGAEPPRATPDLRARADRRGAASRRWKTSATGRIGPAATPASSRPSGPSEPTQADTELVRQ